MGSIWSCRFHEWQLAAAADGLQMASLVWIWHVPQAATAGNVWPAGPWDIC